MRRLNLSLMILLLTPVAASGQIVSANAGVSSLYGSSGGSIKVWNPDGSVMQFGMGDIQGGPLLYGGNISRPFGDFTVVAGDQMLNFGLPTDVAQGSFGFLTRGFFLSPKDAGIRAGGNPAISAGLLGPLATGLNEVLQHCKIFAGVSSTMYGTIYFQAAQASSPLGYLNCRDRLTNNLTWTTLGAFSNRQTAISGLTWKSGDWSLSGVGGIGNGTPYGAILGTFENQGKTFEAKLGYASVQDNFRRVLSASPATLVSENTGLNGSFAWLLHIFRFSGSHQHLLSPVVNAPSIGATFNTGSAAMRTGRLDLNVSDYSSTTNSGIKNSGQVFGAGYKLTDAIQLRSQELRSKDSSVLITSIQERMRQFRFTESYTRSQSNYPGRVPTTSSGFDGGVEYHGNSFSANLSFEEEYFPWVVGRSPFTRVLSISLSAAVHDSAVTIQNYLSPQDKMKFSVSGSQFLYGPYAVQNQGEQHQATHRTMGRYIVQGIVKDESGHPIFGALLQVDGQEVYTDADGTFFLRFRKAGTFPVAALTQKFLVGEWMLVSAPTSAVAKPEDSADSDYLVIIVRRAP